MRFRTKKEMEHATYSELFEEYKLAIDIKWKEFAYKEKCLYTSELEKTMSIVFKRNFYEQGSVRKAIEFVKWLFQGD